MQTNSPSPQKRISDILSSKMHRQYRQRILMIVSSIAVAVSLCYSALLWFIYDNLLSSLTDFIYALLYLCNFYWIKQQKYSLSAYWITLWAGLQTMSGTVLFVGPETGFHLYFLTQPVLVYLLLSKQPRWAQAAIIAYGFILFFISHTLDISGYRVPISDSATHVIFIINALIVFGIIFMAVKFFADEIERAYLAQNSLVLTDNLTRLSNDRYIQQHATKLISLCDRYGHPLSLILLELDHFKDLNTRYDEATGDAALVHIANLLIDDIRDADIAARIGGNEFLIMLPETLPDEAYDIAERLRLHIEHSPLPIHKNKITIRASFGVSYCDSNTVTTIDEVINGAHTALLEAKRCGGNQVKALDA